MLGLFLLKPSIGEAFPTKARFSLRSNLISRAKLGLQASPFPTETPFSRQAPDQRELASFKDRRDSTADFLSLGAPTGRVASFT